MREIVVPFDKRGVITYPQVPLHPTAQSHYDVSAVGHPAQWGCLIISLNGFGLSQLIAPEWV